MDVRYEIRTFFIGMRELQFGEMQFVVIAEMPRVDTSAVEIGKGWLVGTDRPCAPAPTPVVVISWIDYDTHVTPQSFAW